MAITAHFGADFTDFKSAVDAADLKLKGFQTDAAKVQTSLNRIGNAFSGQKIIQEANLAVKAVQEIGGITKLTANDQARLNATLTEAIAKYTALGSKAPADMVALQKATTGAADSTKALGINFQQVSGLLGAFGVTLGAAGIVSFGRALLDSADALVKLSDKTGLSLQGLQKFQIAGDDAGNSVEQLTGAISKLQVQLADTSPSKDFTDQLAKMGLSIRELRSLDPEQQFIAISNAIRQIEDPADQARAAVVLFGRAGAEVLPTLKRGFDDLRDGTVGMSDDTVIALDTAGDALDKYWRKTKGIAAEVAVATIKLLQDPTGQTQLDEFDKQLRAQIDLIAKRRKALIEGDLLGTAAQQAAPIAASEALEKDLERQLAAQRDARREADQLNRERNAAEARWIRISVENNNAWADAVTTIERNMLNERRTLEDAFYRNEEAKALATQRRQLDQFQKSVDDMNAEIQSALIPFAGEVGNDFSKELLDSLKQLRTSVPQLITDSFTGGGGLKGSLKAIGVQLANSFIQAFINELISARGSIKNALAGLFGGGAAKAAGAAGGGGVIAAIGSAIGIGGAPTQKAPENKVPVATNEPQPPAATVITTPTQPQPGQPGYPGGSVTQSILTGGFRSRTTTAAAAPNVTNHNVVNLTIETPDAASFDRSWERQIVPRLHRELFTNALGTVTEINRIVSVKR